jgi:SAM-dependent methyltransferase
LESFIEILNSIGYKICSTRILEVGAGTGWQAKKLSEIGYDVHAIDLHTSNYNEQRIFDVMDYDGESIDFPDDYFDVIFSSNVLEHIPHIRRFQCEIKRVLKPSGVCIHLMPSATWRLWTNISYYFRVIKKLCTHSSPKSLFRESARCDYKSLRKRSLLSKVFPSSHGEIGNCISEIYFFSRFYWKAFFKSCGWSNLNTHSNMLFYSGNSIFGSSMSLRFRYLLHFILGGSCNIYILNKKNEN